MASDFDPQKNRVDRLILQQVLDAKTKVVGGGLSINNERTSSINQDSAIALIDDPGPNNSVPPSLL